MDEKEHVNFIHPGLLEWVQELVPEKITKVNDHTYDLYGARFVVWDEKELVTVGDMVCFLRDNGWEPKEKETEDG